MAKIITLIYLLVLSMPAFCQTSLKEGLQSCHIPNYTQEVLCGSLAVFEDRRQGSGRKIDIHFAVMPAVSVNHIKDPLVLLAGGPGQAARDYGQWMKQVFQQVNENRDIVLVDQRGMGLSHPLDCQFPDIEDRTMTQAALDSLTQDLLRKCLEALDADVKLYQQDLANEDINQILLGLGYQQVNLYGVSWGTRSALLYAHQFPEQVRTMILDGNAPPSNKVSLFTATDSEQALQTLFKDCQADPSCQQAFPQLKQDFKQALHLLGEKGYKFSMPEPLTGIVQSYLITPALFKSTLLSMLYQTNNARMLPLVIHRAKSADFRAMVGILSVFEQASSLSYGALLSIICSEELPRMTAKQISKETAVGFIKDIFFKSFHNACQVWPQGSVPLIYQQDLTSHVPSLIFSGALDPVTPPRWGKKMAEMLPNSLHLIANATGHNVAPVPCADDLLFQFIDQGKLNDIDGTCLQEPVRPSFFINNSGPVANAGNEK